MRQEVPSFEDFNFEPAPNSKEVSSTADLYHYLSDLLDEPENIFFGFSIYNYLQYPEHLVIRFFKKDNGYHSYSVLFKLNKSWTKDNLYSEKEVKEVRDCIRQFLPEDIRKQILETEEKESLLKAERDKKIASFINELLINSSHEINDNLRDLLNKITKENLETNEEKKIKNFLSKIDFSKRPVVSFSKHNDCVDLIEKIKVEFKIKEIEYLNSGVFF